MSKDEAEIGPSEPEPDGAQASAPLSSAARKGKKPRRWRRRFLWCGGIAIVLLIAFRLSLPWLLPWTLGKVADNYGLSCKYDRLELSLHGGDAELWHLTLAPKEGGEPFVHAEYCRADLATPYLVLGRIVVRRLEADGVDLLVERDDDGKLAILKRIEAAAKEGQPKPPPSPEPPPAKPTEPPKEIDLTAPIEIDAMRLQYVHALIRDRTVSPPFETRFNLNVRLSDFASKERPARFEVDASAPPILDSFTIEGEGASLKTDLNASCLVELRGLHLEPLAHYLEPLGLRPAAKDVSFRASAHIEAKAVLAGPEKDAKPPGTIQATVALKQIAATADGAEALALDSLAVNVNELGWRTASVKDVVLEGIRVGAMRSPAGILRAAGLEVVPAKPVTAGAPPRPSPAPAPVSAPASAAPPPSPVTPPAEPFRARLDLLAVRNVRASFRDESVSPPASLALTVEDFSIRNVVFDPDKPESQLDISGKLALPDVARGIRIEGKAVPFARRKTADLKIEATGIAPRGLEPYLKPNGVESMLEDASFTTSVSASAEEADGGGLRADLTLGRTTFGETAAGGKAALLDLTSVRIAGVRVDPNVGAAGIDEIEVVGPQLSARRDASGAVDALGFHVASGGSQSASAPRAVAALVPATSTDDLGEVVAKAAREDAARVVPAIQTEADPATVETKAAALKVRIGRVKWKDFAVQFVDEAVAPPVSLALENFGVEVEALTIDTGDSPEGAPGALTASLKVPGVVESVKVTGTLLPQPAQGALKLDVAARGVALKSLAPYLKAAGLEPELQTGSVQVSVAADYSIRAGLTTASAAITNVVYRDDEAELAGLDALRVSGLVTGTGGLKIASIEIDRPRAAASRDARGVFHFGGLGLTPPPPRPPGDVPQAEPAAPAARGKEDARQAEPPEPGEPFPIELERFRLRDAQLSWADALPAQPVTTALRTSVEIDGIVLGREAEPARFKARVAAEGALEELSTVGTVALTERNPSAVVEVTAHGLKAGPFAAYLPPGLTVKLVDGRFQARVEAALAALDEGGHSASLAITGVDFREGSGPDAFFKLGSFRVLASRIDPEGGHVDVDEVSLGGFETMIQRAAGGATEVLGLSIAPPRNASEPEPGREPEPKTKPDPNAVSGAKPPEPAAPVPAPSTPAARPEKLPLVTLKKLDLNLDRIVVNNARVPEGKPLVASLRLANREVLQVLGVEPEALKPIQLALTGKVDPLVDSILVDLKLSPFTADPELDVTVDVQGIQGKDLTSVLPELKETLDGKALSDGRFQAHVNLLLALKRRSPVDFGLSRGFGAELNIEGVRFTNGKEGPVLAGLDGFRVDLSRMDPKTGAVHVKEVEIQRPIANVRRTREGLEVLGLVIQLPEPGKKPAGESAPATGPAPAAAAANPAPVPATAAAAPPGPAEQPPELRVDKLFVSGIDFRASDTTCDPPAALWLSGLDVDVRNATNRILTEPVSTWFQVALQAGKVPLPVALKRGLIGGVLGDTAALLTGQDVDRATTLEDREVFEDLVLKGRIGLFPQPTGWIQSKASAVDLTAFKGLAAQSGVKIRSGLLDENVLIHLSGDGGAELSTRVKFADLDVSEPPDGPIFRYLHLPSPLNAVLFALVDSEGAISIPLNATKSPGPFGASDLLTPVLATLSKMLGKAVAAAPMRVAGTVTSLLPFGGEAERMPEEPLVLEFAPGDARLSPGEASRLAPLLERARNGELLSFTITHDFGAEDLKRSELRANPSVKECLELGARLRGEKTDLFRRREELSAEARSAVLSGLWLESPALTEKLRLLDRRIADTDLALDQVYNLTRPGAERQAPRRTRYAALALARARVDEVKAVFLSSLAPDARDAVRAPRPPFTETAPDGPGKVRVLIAPRSK